MKKILLIITSLAPICWNNPVNAQFIAAGFDHSLAICNDSTVSTWGNNSAGQLDKLDNDTARNTPSQVSELRNIIALAGGNDYSLALKKNGTVWTWGWNKDVRASDNAMGDGTYNGLIQVRGLTGITSIVGGYNYCLALKNDGKVWGWGADVSGQLCSMDDSIYPYASMGSMHNIPEAIELKGFIDIIAIAGSFEYSFALKRDGTVWILGESVGPRKNRDIISHDMPIQLSGFTGVKAISACGANFLCLKNDGTVWTWKFEKSGTDNGKYIPFKINGLKDIVAIAIGYDHSLVLKNDGTVWTWVEDPYEESGVGNNINSNIPVQVNGLTGITAISAGYKFSLSLKNDGTIWAWGRNNYGQLGNGNNMDSSVPVQVKKLCTVLQKPTQKHK
jgi:alpha-tubulin suppressor-like RCC1 family protein